METNINVQIILGTMEANISIDDFYASMVLKVDSASHTSSSCMEQGSSNVFVIPKPLFVVQAKDLEIMSLL